MPIRLIAVDLDGTLLNASKQISIPTAVVLRRAQNRQGVLIVLASARPPRSVRPFYEQLDLQTPTINYNGALVFHPRTREVMLHRPIPTRTARKAVQLARAMLPEVLVSVEVLDKWYTDHFDERFLAEEDFLTETARLCRPDVIAPIETWLNQAVTKLLLLGKPQPLARVADAIVEQLSEEVSLVQTEDYLIQVAHTMASKAVALRAEAARLGVERQEVMAIGDNANDVGMLRWAGIGVAMANAHEQTLAAANYVTDSHEADGVARAVQKIVLEGVDPGA